MDFRKNNIPPLKNTTIPPLHRLSWAENGTTSLLYRSGVRRTSLHAGALSPETPLRASCKGVKTPCHKSSLIALRKGCFYLAKGLLSQCDQAAFVTGAE